MNKEEKARLWSERIREFRSSGQTCRDWCREHQIPVSTMTYWIRRLKKSFLYVCLKMIRSPFLQSSLLHLKS